MLQPTLDSNETRISLTRSADRILPTQSKRKSVSITTDKTEETTLVMIDIVDSSYLVESLEPEIVCNLFTEYYLLVEKQVGKYSGKLIRCVGDGIQLVFPSKNKSEAQTQRENAIQFSLQLAKSLPKDIEKLKIVKEFGIRIAVVSGTAVVSHLNGINQTVVFGLLPYIAHQIKHLAMNNEVVFCTASNTIGESVERVNIKGVKTFSLRNSTNALTVFNPLPVK